MKKLIVLCLALVMMLPVEAKIKVVERSAKRQPTWVKGNVDQHLVLTAEAATLGEAQHRCMENLRQEIINSVSVNISSEEVSKEQQTLKDGQEQITKEYESNIRTIAAQLPYIANLSMADAETYWEHRVDKKKGTDTYVSWVKYPFSDTQRKKLVREFKAQDHEMWSRYQRLEAELDTFTHIEQIDRNIEELNPLIEYFFDKRRHAQAVSLQKNYRKMYSAIHILPYEQRLGEYVFALKLGDRRLLTSRTPILKCETASNLQVQPMEDGLYRLTYDYSKAQPTDENMIQMVYRLPLKTLKQEIHFDVRDKMIQITPYGEVKLHIAPQEEDAPKITGQVMLRQRSDEAKIQGISLVVDGMELKSTTAKTFKSKGNHTYLFDLEGTWHEPKQDETILEGTLEVVAPNGKSAESLTFHLPYVINRK